MALRYRQLQAPVLLDDTQDNGGAAAATALSNTFKTFEQASLGIAGDIRAGQGRREGAAAGLQSAFKPRLGFFSHTAYSEAFNTAGFASYLSKTATDIDATVDRIEQETQGDSASYAAKVAGFSKGLLSGVPKELMPRVELMLQARTAAGSTRVRAQEMEDTRQKQHADFLEGMDARASLAMKSLDGPLGDASLVSLVTDNDLQADALVKDHVITATQAQQYKQAFKQKLDQALAGSKLMFAVDGLMSATRQDVEAGDRAVRDLEARTDLDSHDKRVIIDEFQKQRTNFEYAQSRAYMPQSTALAQSLASGAYGPELEHEARRLYRAGAISSAEFEAHMVGSARNEQKAIEDGADINAVEHALNDGHGLDPTNEKQRKAADKLFQQLTTTAGTPPGSDRWQIGAIEFARRANVLPESAQSWARVNLLSRDPNAASVAASFMKRVEDANPLANPYNDDPKLATLVDRLNTNLANGLSPQNAYELALKSWNMTDEQRNVIKERYRADKVGQGNADALRSALNGSDKFDPSVFSSAPSASIAMQAEYDSLVEQYFAATGGNTKQARDLAFRALSSLWGVSEVNGSREVMKYPPELYGLPPAFVRTDIAQTLHDAGVAVAQDSVRLVPNAATERTKGRVWTLVHTDEYGAQDVLLDQRNKPVLYQLPLGQDFERTRDAIKRSKLEAAQRERDAEQRNAADQTELEKHLRAIYSVDPSLRNR